MTTVENPIKIFSKRNKDEIKNILETLNLTENKNNYFTDKYEIYLENTGQIIRVVKIIFSFLPCSTVDFKAIEQ